jgi:hypothetical protein
VTPVSKFWAARLIITFAGGSEITVTGNRRRTAGIVRTRGGTRIPDKFMVAIRKFIVATSAVLRTTEPAV